MGNRAWERTNQSQTLIPFSTQSLRSEPSFSSSHSLRPSSRQPCFRPFPHPLNTSLSTAVFSAHHPSTAARRRQAHISALIIYLLTLDLHDFLSVLFVMATHGPINGVKRNRACSGSFAHILARSRFFFLPLARIGCSALIPASFLATPPRSPQSIAVRLLPPPSALAGLAIFNYRCNLPRSVCQQMPHSV